jgi:prolyl oligopeptidase
MIDQYKWAEDITSEQTLEYYSAQNLATDKYFTDHPADHYADRLLQQSDSMRKSLDQKYGNHSYRMEQQPEWPHPYLMHDDEIMLDMALDFYFPSPDGSRVVIGTSELGNEQTTIQVFDHATDTLMSDRIAFSGFTDQGDICWLDNSSFIYPRMNGFSQKGPTDKWLLGTKLYMHKIGTDPKNDPLIFGADLPDTVMLIPTLSSDKKRLFIAVCEDELTHTQYLLDLNSLMAKKINIQDPASVIIKSHKGTTYALTNYQASKYRLLSCPNDDIELDLDDWEEIISESVDVLMDFWLTSGGDIMAKYSRNVSSALKVFDCYGNQISDVPIPKFCTIADVVCDLRSPIVHIAVSGLTIPTQHLKTSSPYKNTTVMWSRSPQRSDTNIVVDQYQAVSKDGTKIPYFCIRLKSLDQPAPCILYGYGGFNISLEPSYLGSSRPWIEDGGVYVVAGLRGGSELGEQWHKLGSMEHKQNTFDDCAAVAEDLIARKITTSEQLGVMGGSNGGLMVAAVTLQRPDLFRAGVALVPLTDMLEFYKHQVAEFWVHEYGDPRIPEQKNWISKWSPYHYPIDPEKRYPALYYETALHDARVHPFHAIKMVARLQDSIMLAKGPILLRTILDSGHQPANHTRAQIARSTAEYYTFMSGQLNSKS